MHRTANYSTLTTHTPIPKFLDAIGAAQSDINRRNSRKTNPLSQPTAISDKIGRLCLQIVGLLREGASSSVFEVKDRGGTLWACKVVAQASLTTKRAKTQLYANIRINSALHHPNIVNFWTCFDDNENVYMMLQLCSSGSLTDMLRQRRCLTEPETRFFMVQIIGACDYMHTRRVVHRNLILDNLLLDKDMNLKVGNFGLATLVDTPGDRMPVYTTRYYFSPGALFDIAHPPEFETDLRFIGVILYTLIVGKSPFEKNRDDIGGIYPRVKATEYEFPADRAFSSSVQHLVALILAPNGSKSPTLQSIVAHAFFTQGPVPDRIPTSALSSVPNFKHIRKYDSDTNLKRLVDSSFRYVPHAWRTSGDGSISQRHMEFQQAIEPRTPISTLLELAKQPLFSPTGDDALRGDAVRRKSVLTQGMYVDQENVGNGWAGAVQPMGHARLGIARMEPVREEDGTDQRRPLRGKEAERNATNPEHINKANLVPALTRSTSAKNRLASSVKKLINIPQAYFGFSLSRVSTPSSEPDDLLKLNNFDSIAQTLTMALKSKVSGRIVYGPVPWDGVEVSQPNENVFIAHCVENIEGGVIGYFLTDGSVGVQFTDNTTLVLSPDKGHFGYVSPGQWEGVYLRKSFTVKTIPEELKSKSELLERFEKYNNDVMLEKRDNMFKDLGRVKGMEWVQRRFQTVHASVFILSHNVVQFNFVDHSTLILSSDGNVVTYIDEKCTMTRRRLHDIMASILYLRPSPLLLSFHSPPRWDQDTSSLDQRIVDKLVYCVDTFKQISGLGADGKITPARDPHESLNIPNLSIYSGGSASFYSKASSRTASTDYGLFYTRRAFSQDNLSAMSMRGSRAPRV